MNKIAILSILLFTQPLTSLIGEPSQSTITDQIDVAVTAYNSDIALVRDRRKLALESGIQSLTFMDVAQLIKPETVNLRSLTEPHSINILEQNYEYDLLSPHKILEKYVGKTVKLRNFSNEYTFKETDAELMSLNDGPIYKVGNQIHLNHPGSVVLPEIPENLIAKPSLVMLLENKSAEPIQDIAVTYITGGIRWAAHYVLHLDRDDTTFDLKGYVALTNQSGTSYNNASLKLIAGDVHRAPQPNNYSMHQKMARAAFAGGESMHQETFGDFHLYALPRRTTIKDQQTKQIQLLAATGARAQKVYEFRGQTINHYMPDAQKNQKVGVYLKFKNSEDNHIGLPLPAGTIRVYQEDSEGMEQFAGEDAIVHTPKDEEVALKLGDAFDIVGEKTQTKYSQLSQNNYRSSYFITLRNHKDADVTVHVIESLGNNGHILEASREYSRLDSSTISFPIDIPHNGTSTLTYTVEVKS